MTDQHRATSEQWEHVAICAGMKQRVPWATAACLLELRSRVEALEQQNKDLCIAVNNAVVWNTEQNQRIEALEAAQLEQAESNRFCTDAIVRRVEALEAGATCPHIVSSDEGTSYCRLAEQTQDKLDRLIALDRDDPTPDTPMAELRAASAEARPTVKESLTDGGSLLERVANAIYNVPHDSAAEARAAIREVAVHVRKHNPFFELDTPIESDVWEAVAELLEREANL
jgi:hypothetical protein